MKTYVIAAALMLFSTAVFSQEVVTFESGTSSASTGKKKSRKSAQSSEKNIVKINPLGFLIGRTHVSFERELTETFSIQASVGVTSKRYLLDILDTRGDDDNEPSSRFNKGVTYSPNVIDPENIDFADVTKRKYSLGYSFALEPRVYLSSEGLSGGYFGLSGGYRTFNYTQSASDISRVSGSTLSPNKSFKGKSTETDLLVRYGSQILNDKISIDWNVSIGLRTTKSTELGAYLPFSGTGSETFVTMTGKKSELAGGVSLLIGFHF
jgi:hypothetical protein